MKDLKLRDKEGFWNEKFYGKDLDEIYFDGERIKLTEEEKQSIKEQRIRHQENEKILEAEERSLKRSQIINYITELAKITDDNQELLKYFIEIKNEMEDIYRRRNNK